MQKPFVTVGVDGSVYRFHPTFPRLLDEKIHQLIDKKLKVCFKLKAYFYLHFFFWKNETTHIADYTQQSLITKPLCVCVCVC